MLSRLAVSILAASLSALASGQLSEAERLIEAGHWKQARAIVQSRISQAPDDPLASFLLSQIRHAFGDDASPRPLAEKAIALDGRVAKFHRQLAEVLGIEARHANPIKLAFLAHQFRREIDAAISLNPLDIQAQRDLLEYYLVAPGIAGGDVQKAGAVAKHIGELSPVDGLLARARVASFRKQDAQAETFFREAGAMQPPHYRARAELANFYLSSPRPNPAAAEAAAKDLIRLDPTRIDGWSVLAQIYAVRENWSALDSLLADAAKEVPDDRSPCYRAAEASPDPARAERYLRTYLEQEPEGNAPTLADARKKLAQLSRKGSR